MIGRRLQYHSQKAVLLHMDANVRFKISLHMPSIRSAEKVVPLKMNTLVLNDVTTCVNDTCYEVGVDRLFPDGSAPKCINDECNLDYDEFGFPSVSGHDVLLPGDVSFQMENEKVRYDTEEDEREYRQGLRNNEELLDFLKTLYYLDLLNYRNSEEVPLHEYRKVARRIEGYKQELLPFDCRRDNSKRQFNCYATLYIHKRGVSSVKRFEYNKKLFEASKYLNEVFFGGRTMPMRVGELSLGDFAILRLPVGFQLHVQSLTRHDDLAHKNLPLIVGNLESLDCLKVYTDDLRLDGYKSRIVRNAKKLIIDGDEDFMDTQVIFRVIRDLQNLEIGIETENSTMSKEFHTTTIENWLNGDRQDGACLWMETGAEETGQNMADEVLEWIETRYERSERNERCVTVPLRNSTMLKVCSVPFKDSSWMLKLNILKF